MNNNFSWNHNPNQSSKNVSTTPNFQWSTNTSNKNEDKIKTLEDKVNVLEKKITSMSSSLNKRKYDYVTHFNITCNNCKKNNISGIRYLCGNCNNYNICDECIHFAEEIHPNNHFFIRIHNSITWNSLSS